MAKSSSPLMTPAIIDFLRANKIAVLTTMISDGGPHSATMYYAFDQSEETFYFVADINDMKCENLSEEDDTFASMVIGFDQDKWQTMQFRGSAKLVPQDAEEFVIKNLFKNMSYLSNFLDHPDRAFIKFTPAWWRFTDAANGSITITD